MASLAQFAFNTVRDGISARAGLARMRAEGLKVRDATWFRAVGEARAHYGHRLAEMGGPQNVAPRRDKVPKIPTKVQRGFRQYVDIWIKERGVDTPRLVTQAVITQKLLSRQAAVDKAVAGYRAAQARRQTTGSTTITPSDARIVGAIYTTELEFIPENEFAPQTPAEAAGITIGGPAAPTEPGLERMRADLEALMRTQGVLQPPQRVQKAIQDILRESGRQGPGWVDIATVRERVGLPRQEFDALIREMSTGPRAVLTAIPEEVQRTLTSFRREGAVSIGGEANHLIRIR